MTFPVLISGQLPPVFKIPELRICKLLEITCLKQEKKRKVGTLTNSKYDWEKKSQFF